MTTITIDKELLEQVVNKLLTCWPKSDPLVNELRAALAAPATAPEPVAWLAHYVGRSGMEQEYVSTDKNLADENDASGKALPLYLHPPATAPAWHVAPTVPGLWVSDFSWMAQKLDRETVEFYAKNRSIPSRRWYGPISEDKP